MADKSSTDAAVRRLAELLSLGAITLADFDERRKALLQPPGRGAPPPPPRRSFQPAAPPAPPAPSYRQAAALPPSRSYQSSPAPTYQAPAPAPQPYRPPYRPATPRAAVPPPRYAAAPPPPAAPLPGLRRPSLTYAAAPTPAYTPARAPTYAPAPAYPRGATTRAPPPPAVVPHRVPPYRSAPPTPMPAPVAQYGSPRGFAPRPPLRPAPGKMLPPTPRPLAAHPHPYARPSTSPAAAGAPPPLRKVPGARTVVVRPVPASIQEQELYDCLGTFGAIKNIVVQKEEGLPSCAIVTFVDVEAAQQAVAAQFVSLDAVICFVQKDVGRSAAHRPDPSSVLLLSNLPAEVSVRELREALAQYPGFQTVRPPTPPTHGAPGYAIAHFATVDDAVYARHSLLGLVLGSHLVEPRFARVDSHGAVIPDVLG